MGVESLQHLRVKEQAVNHLKSLGFNDNEIIEEYNFRTGKFVDIAGIKKDFKVAIECGNTGKYRVKFLKQFFDKVYHFPYILPNAKKDHYIEPIDEKEEERKKQRREDTEKIVKYLKSLGRKSVSASNISKATKVSMYKLRYILNSQTPFISMGIGTFSINWGYTWWEEEKRKKDKEQSKEFKDE